MSVNTDTTIVVSIGRNIPAGQHAQNSEPLPEKAWEDFKAHVFTLITTARGTILSTANGKGVWEGETEETFIIMALLPGQYEADLRKSLGVVGSHYGQDAIGFVSAPLNLSLIEC